MAQPETKEKGIAHGLVAKTLLPGLDIVDVYDVVDIEDILAHLRKAVTDKWAYRIDFEDKPARGLGIVGSRETAAIIAKLSRGQHVIRVIPGTLKVQEFPDAWEAEVYAGLYIVWTDGETGMPRELLLNSLVGFHRQPKKGVRKDGSTWVIGVPDKLAVSKAQRNAISGHIPDKWVTKIVQVAEDEGKMADETGESRATKTGKPATDKQRGAIEALIKSRRVDEPTRDHYQELLDGDLTIRQASKCIQDLQKIANNGPKKESDEKGKNGQQSFA